MSATFNWLTIFAVFAYCYGASNNSERTGFYGAANPDFAAIAQNYQRAQNNGGNYQPFVNPQQKKSPTDIFDSPSPLAKGPPIQNIDRNFGPVSHPLMPQPPRNTVGTLDFPSPPFQSHQDQPGVLPAPNFAGNYQPFVYPQQKKSPGDIFGFPSPLAPNNQGQPGLLPAQNSRRNWAQLSPDYNYQEEAKDPPIQNIDPNFGAVGLMPQLRPNTSSALDFPSPPVHNNQGQREVLSAPNFVGNYQPFVNPQQKKSPGDIFGFPSPLAKNIQDQPGVLPVQNNRRNYQPISQPISPAQNYPEQEKGLPMQNNDGNYRPIFNPQMLQSPRNTPDTLDFPSPPAPSNQGQPHHAGNYQPFVSPQNNRGQPGVLTAQQHAGNYQPFVNPQQQKLGFPSPPVQSNQGQSNRPVFNSILPQAQSNGWNYNTFANSPDFPSGPVQYHPILGGTLHAGVPHASTGVYQLPPYSYLPQQPPKKEITDEEVIRRVQALFPTKSPPTSPKANSCGNNKECVKRHLCIDGQSNIYGNNTISIRKGDFCHYLEVCCEIPNVVDEQVDVQLGKAAPVPREIVKCGERNANGVGFRILDHEDNESEFGEFPWIVAILQHKEEKYECGGAILAPTVAITAAHCVDTFANFRDLFVRAGEWDMQTRQEILPHQDRNISEIIIHEGYRAASLRNDIALLMLTNAFVWQDNIKPICLPEANENFDSATCFASGWGQNIYARKDEYQVILKKIEMRIVPEPICQANLRNTQLGKMYRLHESYLCAGGQKDKDTCKGDGGSPLICPIPGEINRYIVAGLVSWGLKCGQERVPGIYTNIFHLRSWLDEKLLEKDIDSSHYTPYD